MRIGGLRLLTHSMNLPSRPEHRSCVISESSKPNTASVTVPQSAYDDAFSLICGLMSDPNARVRAVV